jgi:hypothetical protein
MNLGELESDTNFLHDSIAKSYHFFSADPQIYRQV